MPVQDLTKIEDRLDKVLVGGIEVSEEIGGILIKNMNEVMEWAKLMSLAGTAVPKHLRGSPGACLAVTVQALEWRMSPFAVANKSYEVNDRIAYEAQLIHAVIETRAKLKERLRFRFDGEGPDLKCFCIGQFARETTALEYESPTFSNIKVRNSPLWVSDPKQQFSYYSARAWARRYCPDVILGIYSDDELADAGIGADHARDITPPKPTIGERLSGGSKRGFSAAHVEKTLPASRTPAAEPVRERVGSGGETVASVVPPSGTTAGPIASELVDDGGGPSSPPNESGPARETAHPPVTDSYDAVPVQEPPTPPGIDNFAALVEALIGSADVAADMAALNAIDDEACNACADADREDQRVLWNVAYKRNHERIELTTPATKETKT